MCSVNADVLDTAEEHSTIRLLLGTKTPQTCSNAEIILPVRDGTTLLLTTNSKKPIPEWSDEFWETFCQEVECIFQSKFSALQLLLRILSVGSFAGAVLFAYLMNLVESCLMFLACAILWYLKDVPIGADAAFKALLDTLNVHYYENLKGYKLFYETEHFGRRCHLKFEYLVQNLVQKNGNEGSQEEQVFQPENREFHIYLYAPAAVQRGENCYPLDVETPPPPGISPTAWTTFLEDISSDVKSYDDGFRRMLTMSLATTTVLLTILQDFLTGFQLISIVFTQHYVLFRLSFRALMVRKFKMIKVFGGGLFGPSYDLSYHPVEWYSRCEDYISIKRRDEPV